MSPMTRALRASLFAAALALPVAAIAASPPTASGYKVPRTSFGDPDLQGVWTNVSVTTLERNAGSPAAMTEEQAKTFEAMMAKRSEAEAAPSDPNEGAPKDGSGAGGYNGFWLDAGTHFARIKGQVRTSWVVEPADGRIPYTEAGRKGMALSAAGQRDNRNPETLSLGERCIVGYGSTSGPPMINVLYNNNYQFVQAPGVVAIVVEMNHDVRIIRLGGVHPPASITPWTGDSIGHWDGDTLVVETTNMHPGQSFAFEFRHRFYVPPTAKVTERFTRISKDQIFYEFTVEDAVAYTQPWRGEMVFDATEGPVYEYACHEGNYAMPGIIGGARSDEKAAADAKQGASK